MKKRSFLLMVIAVLVAFLCISAGPSIPKDLYVAPDPENPFQGTWYTKIGNLQSLHVIEGMNGTWYLKALGSWKKNAVYTIKENDNGEYTTSTYWRINVNGNILTVESNTYEKVVK
jgi:hypothetical protein